jgi:esterase/lipase
MDGSLTFSTIVAIGALVGSLVAILLSRRQQRKNPAPASASHHNDEVTAGLIARAMAVLDSAEQSYQKSNAALEATTSLLKTIRQETKEALATRASVDEKIETIHQEMLLLIGEQGAQPAGASGKRWMMRGL